MVSLTEFVGWIFVMMRMIEMMEGMILKQLEAIQLVLEHSRKIWNFIVVNLNVMILDLFERKWKEEEVKDYLW